MNNQSRHLVTLLITIKDTIRKVCTGHSISNIGTRERGQKVSSKDKVNTFGRTGPITRANSLRVTVKGLESSREQSIKLNTP